MTDTKTESAAANEETSDKPVIHKVCEGCNNMFATHAGEAERRCPNCRKD